MIDFKFVSDNSAEVVFHDHLNGFSKDYSNEYLDYAKVNFADKKIVTEYILNDKAKEKYKLLNIQFDISKWIDGNFVEDFESYNVHPDLDYKNFICSFNGSNHVSRQLLTAILANQNLFKSGFSSKNFSYSNDKITAHLSSLDLTKSETCLYEKFFINSDDFNNTIYSFGYVQGHNATNIYNLENKLTQSFLHIVSETMATSYHPFVTEKFLYSIVTRGLFLAYAQPGWHKHIEKYYGFKLYNKIFDYNFDAIQNPVKRLIRLMEMISKFKTLSKDDWRDLYLLEQDNIEYNYEHYFSGNYLKYIAQIEK